MNYKSTSLWTFYTGFVITVCHCIVIKGTLQPTNNRKQNGDTRLLIPMVWSHCDTLLSLYKTYQLSCLNL